MAIDTINKKRALMLLGLPFADPPISADGIDQADQQQLLNEYPGLAWAAWTAWIDTLTGDVILTLSLAANVNLIEVLMDDVVITETITKDVQI